MSLICPKCQSEWTSYERHGVTVDQCTGCRGVFLDKGELQQLSAAENAWHAGPMGLGGGRGGMDAMGGQTDKKTRKFWKKERRKRKRKSFMENLFEFGGEGD